MRAQSSNAIHETVGSADCLRRQRHQQRPGASDVADGENAAAKKNRPGDDAARVLNLSAHRRAGLHAAKRKEHAGPEDCIIERPVGNKARRGIAHFQSETQERKAGEHEQEGEWKQATKRADIVQPFARIDAAHVEQRDDAEPKRRKTQVVQRT
jgi:hypothetical protein